MEQFRRVGFAVVRGALARIVIMKLISYNIRGLGGLAKKKEMLNLIRKQKPNLICIQETKMEFINRALCYLMWGSNDFDFAFKLS